MQMACYSYDVIQTQRTHVGIMPVCAVNVLLNNEHILDHFFFQTVVLASKKIMKL